MKEKSKACEKQGDCVVASLDLNASMSRMRARRMEHKKMAEDDAENVKARRKRANGGEVIDGIDSPDTAGGVDILVARVEREMANPTENLHKRNPRSPLRNPRLRLRLAMQRRKANKSSSACFSNSRPVNQRGGRSLVVIR